MAILDDIRKQAQTIQTEKVETRYEYIEPNYMDSYHEVNPFFNLYRIIGAFHTDIKSPEDFWDVIEDVCDTSRYYKSYKMYNSIDKNNIANINKLYDLDNILFIAGTRKDPEHYQLELINGTVFLAYTNDNKIINLKEILQMNETASCFHRLKFLATLHDDPKIFREIIGTNNVDYNSHKLDNIVYKTLDDSRSWRIVYTNNKFAKELPEEY